MLRSESPILASDAPMSSQPTKLQRWLDVVAHLARHHFPLSVEELWDAVPAYRPGLEGDERRKQTVRRMFERDKDELRALGIPIDTVSYSINYGHEEVVGYRLAKKDFHLPYLRLVREVRGDGAADEKAAGAHEPRASASHFTLTTDEAGAALEGLSELARLPTFPFRSAARSAFRKLAFDLDPELVGEAPVVYAQDPEAAATQGLLPLLAAAVRSRRAVRFRYRGITRDTDEERHVHPYGLLFQHGRWYLVGRDVEKDARRMFRVGRMSELHEAPARRGGTPDYDVPDDFALAEYGGRSAWELGGDEGEPATGAVVRFAFPRSLWAERNGHGTLLEEAPDGAQLRRFEVRRREPFLRWVLSLAGEAWVTAPDELCRELEEMAGAIVRRYGGGR